MKNKVIMSVLSAAMLLSGCLASRPENFPEDNPCNHIRNYSIMETENGYYTNAHGEDFRFWNSISLKFIERDTDKEVYLCARPECMHDGGEMCTATYKHLNSINSVLYNGAIYTFVTEEINEAVSYSIYRSALDGSSITRVGSAFSANNPKNEEYGTFYTDYFIIHKGYAYVPYHLSFGGNMFGFVGSGLARMNLADGSSEILYSCENYYDDIPRDLQGSGDNVYFTIHGNLGAGAFAYNINDGTIEKLETVTQRAGYVAGERCFVTVSYNLTDDYEWGDPYDICTVDKETGKVTNLVHIEEKPEHCASALPYKDMIIVTLDSGVYFYSESGELLQSAEYLSTEKYGKADDFAPHCSTAIVGDKLYLYVFGTYDDWQYHFYSCPIDDILNGQGEWKYEYSLDM